MLETLLVIKLIHTVFVAHLNRIIHLYVVVGTTFFTLTNENSSIILFRFRVSQLYWSYNKVLLFSYVCNHFFSSNHSDPEVSCSVYRDKKLNVTLDSSLFCILDSFPNLWENSKNLVKMIKSTQDKII